MYQSARKREYECYVCQKELLDEEKEFYPCNCNYPVHISSSFHSRFATGVTASKLIKIIENALIVTSSIRCRR